MTATLPLSNFALVCFFLGVLCITFLKTVEINHPFNGVLRLLFPSWKFFDRPGHLIRLDYRLQHADSAITSNWQPVLQSQKRTWTCLFLNPQGNLHLACQSLVEQLVTQIQNTPENQLDSIFESTSYQLVKNLAYSHAIQNSGLKNQYSFFQLRITIDEDDTLVSPLYGL